MSKVLLMLLVLAAGLSSVSAEERVWDMKDSAYWRRKLVVPVEDITPAKMEKTAQEFLRLAGVRRIVVLSVFVSRGVAAEQGAPRSNYKQWKGYYDSLPKHARVSAHMIAISGDAVLWVRDVEGRITRRVLKGRDPTKFSVDGTAFEILYVAGRVMTKFERCATPGAIEPVFYVITPAELTEELCTRAGRWLARKLEAKHLAVRFRNDQWFVPGSSFPVAYPFAPTEAPPTEAEYHRSVSYYCGIFRGKPLDCRQTMGLALTPRRPVRER